VPISASFSDTNVDNAILPPQNPPVRIDNPSASETTQMARDIDAGAATDDSMSCLQIDTPEISIPGDTMKRSTVRTLRGILKKPRRYSKDSKILETDGCADAPKQTKSDSNSTTDSVVPEVSSQHSEELRLQPDRDLESQPPEPDTVELSSYKIKRGSLQMAAFDRLLFAKRGAELRDEYMRGFPVTE
jgi:hypothetical protein